MKRLTKNYNSTIVEFYKIKPILFNRVLGEIANSATAGLFLSQLLFWCDKGASSYWIYKTIEDVKAETCLKRSEQSCAIETWKALGVLEVRLGGIPRRRFFHIDIPTLGNLIVKHLRKSSLQESTDKRADHDTTDGQNQHAITESVREKNQRSDLKKSYEEKRAAFGRNFNFPGK